MKRFAIIAAAALAAGGFGYVGCDRDETASNTNPSGETAGDKVDRALDRTGDAAGRAVDKTAEAGRDLADKTAELGRDVGDKATEAGRDLRAKTSDGADAMAERASSTLRGEGTAAAPDAEGIRDVLASATEAALKENGLNDLAERLVDADRNRIGDAIGADFPEHAALVNQFLADWQAKYNQEFDIKEATALPEATFAIRQGEVGRAAAGTEVDLDRDADGTASVDVDAKSGVDSPDTTAADANRNDPGRNVASVAVKASHGMPSLTVPLVHEAPDAWRIDAPDSLDAAKLKQNVLEHLRAAHAMKDQWPADVNEAYAAVTHHVLMAILDKPVQQN